MLLCTLHALHMNTQACFPEEFSDSMSYQTHTHTHTHRFRLLSRSLTSINVTVPDSIRGMLGRTVSLAEELLSQLMCSESNRLRLCQKHITANNIPPQKFCLSINTPMVNTTLHRTKSGFLKIHDKETLDLSYMKLHNHKWILLSRIAVFSYPFFYFLFI